MERDNLGFTLKTIKKGLEGNKNKLKSKTNWLDIKEITGISYFNGYPGYLKILKSL